MVVFLLAVVAALEGVVAVVLMPLLIAMIYAAGRRMQAAARTDRSCRRDDTCRYVLEGPKRPDERAIAIEMEPPIPEAPVGDELAGEVQIHCQTGTRSTALLSESGHWYRDRKLYIEHRLKAIRLAQSITDELYRDIAFSKIIDLCMASHDLSSARRILREVTSDIVRDKVLESHPQLRAVQRCRLSPKSNNG